MPRQDEVAREVQRVLGRAATQAELDFFGKFIDEGHLQPYEVGQFLEQSSEGQQARLPGMVNQYSQQMAQNDDQIMSRAGDQLRSQFAQQGRGFQGSGYAAAYANASRDLALSRRQEIGNFYGQQMGNIAGGYGADSLQRGYGLRDEQRKRNWSIEDYYTQQNDHANYLKGQQTRNLQSQLTSAGIQLGMMGIGAGMGYAGGGWAGAAQGFGGGK